MGLQYDECAYKGTNYIVTKDTCRVNTCRCNVISVLSNIVAKGTCRINTWGSNVICVLIMVLIT